MPNVLPPDIDPMKTNPVIPELRCQSHKCAACQKELLPVRFNSLASFAVMLLAVCVLVSSYLTK